MGETRGLGAGAAALQLWGGHECTVNRVGDRFFDQTIRTGHQHRLDDLERFASLGVTSLRYPVLWERISPDRADLADWRWSDERLAEIRRLGITPIAGLLHHGSGPRYTHMLDAGFAPGLARHARAVAERYPWVEAYTPVNEPLTTARFSALYGHWYPHARDEGAFFHALMNEIEATVLAMREIRAVNPAARLVQTEDLGHIFATDPLAHQAAFENERRWVTFDLLCGRITPDHVLWRFFEGHGLADRVRALNDAPCPPDVMGLNYYLSSERFLDHRSELYAPAVRGGNGRDTYADVEAIRAVAPGVMGVGRLLEAAYDRFGLPLAITEAHVGCTREEQLRWLRETWRAAQDARSRGVPVQAVTVWSLLGAVDWNSLLTQDAGHYEPGVFDVRSGAPRPTALAQACRELAAGTTPSHPAAAGDGWWSRDIRYTHQPVWAGQTLPVRRVFRTADATHRPILITGATGRLGQAFARACEHRNLPYVLTDRGELAIEDAEAVELALQRHTPWAVVNAAGCADPEAAQANEACLTSDTQGVERLARACRLFDIKLLTASSALVFDGAKAAPYLEDDAADPLSALGRAKRLAEDAVEAHGGLVVRTGLLFCPLDADNFAHVVTRTLAQGKPLRAADDQRMSPTYTPDFVDHALDLLIDGETGLRHLANAGALSWADFARRIAVALELDADLVQAVAGAQLAQAAPRPANAALASRFGALLPSVESAVARYAAAVRPTLNIAAVKPAVAPERKRSRLGEPRSFAPASAV